MKQLSQDLFFLLSIIFFNQAAFAQLLNAQGGLAATTVPATIVNGDGNLDALYITGGNQIWTADAKAT